MLIGPTITLEKLEKRMRDALVKTQNKTSKLSRELKLLQSDVNSLPRTIEHPEAGRIANPAYLEKYAQFQNEQNEYRQLGERNDFLKTRIAELEIYEENARNKGKFVSKSTETITLTLNDVVMLDLPSSDLDPEQPKELVEV